MPRQSSFPALVSACALASCVLLSSYSAAGDPVPAPSNDKKAALQANARGSKAIDQKSYDVAIQELESATKLDPDLAMAWVNLGWARFNSIHTKDLGRAESDERKGVALASDPRQKGAALYNLGRILEGKGDWAGAATQYRESLKLRPGNKTVAAAQFRAEHFKMFAKAVGYSESSQKHDNVVGPIAWTPKAGSPVLAAGVIVTQSENQSDQADQAQTNYSYTVGVVDGSGKLLGKIDLKATDIDGSAEDGSGDAKIDVLALGNGESLLRADKVEERTDKGTGNWPTSHYDYLTLFSLEGGKLKQVLSRPVRVEKGFEVDQQPAAWKIEMKVVGTDLVFDEAPKKKSKPAPQTVTYKLQGGIYQPDKKSIVPGDR